MTLNGVLGSSTVSYNQGSTGAATITQQAKNQQVVSVMDFGTATQAVTAITGLGTGTLVVPNMATATLPATYPAVVVDYQSQTNQSVYAESESGRFAKRLLKTQHGAHSGTQQVGVLGIEHRPSGSGANGAANSDMGVNISVIKQNYLTSTMQGEIDGLNVVVRQGGPAGNGSTTNSDAAGLLIDVGMLSGSGFVAAYEGSTSIFNSSGVTTNQIQTQIGVLDSTTATHVGFAAIAGNGVIDDGIRLLSSGTGSFTNFMTFYNTGGTNVFRVNGNGNLTLTANGGVTPSKTIRVLSGQLSILNDAQNVQILVLDDSGNVNIAGGITSASGVTGTQMIATGAATAAAAAGTVRYGGTVTGAVGAAGGASALPATPLGYIICNVAGTGVKIHYYNS